MKQKSALLEGPSSTIRSPSPRPLQSLPSSLPPPPPPPPLSYRDRPPPPPPPLPAFLRQPPITSSSSTNPRTLPVAPLPVPERAEGIPRQHAESIAPTRPEGVFIGGDTVLLLQEIVDLRERDITKRIYINNGLRDLKYKSLHATKAQEDFMKASAMLMDSDQLRTMDAKVVHVLQEAWKRLQELTSDAKSREKQQENAQIDLLNLENKLFMKEGDFYGRLRDFTRGAFTSALDAPTDDFTTLSTSSDSSTSTVSVAHNYYNRVGDINLLRERLFNFDSEHRRNKFVRDLARKEGRTVTPPNRVFIQQYFTEREVLIHDYITAKKDMEELRQMCERQGVEVQAPDLPPVLDHSQRIEDPLHLHMDESVRKGSHRHFSDLYGLTHREHRIELWVRDVQKNDNINHFNSSVANVAPSDRASSPQSDTENPRWTVQPIEDYPALSSYNRLQASSTSECSIDTEVPEGTEKRLAPIRHISDTFEGEAPSRRHSSANLSAFAKIAHLSNDNLAGMQTEDLEAPCEFCGRGYSKSLDVPW